MWGLDRELTTTERDWRSVVSSMLRLVGDGGAGGRRVTAEVSGGEAGPVLHLLGGLGQLLAGLRQLCLQLLHPPLQPPQPVVRDAHLVPRLFLRRGRGRRSGSRGGRRERQRRR